MTADRISGNFIADHLRDRAHRSQQRIFVAARPSRHEDGKLLTDPDGEKRTAPPHPYLPATMLRPMGMTAKPRNVAITRTSGASKCTTLSAARGTMSSLVRVLRPSAIGWKRPYWPHAVRTVTILNSAQSLALHYRDQCEQQREKQNDGNTEIRPETMGCAGAGTYPTSQCFKITKIWSIVSIIFQSISRSIRTSLWFMPCRF